MCYILSYNIILFYIISHYKLHLIAWCQTVWIILLNNIILRKPDKVLISNCQYGVPYKKNYLKRKEKNVWNINHSLYIHLRLRWFQLLIFLIFVNNLVPCCKFFLRNVFNYLCSVPFVEWEKYIKCLKYIKCIFIASCCYLTKRFSDLNLFVFFLSIFSLFIILFLFLFTFNLFLLYIFFLPLLLLLVLVLIYSFIRSLLQYRWRLGYWCYIASTNPTQHTYVPWNE